DFHILGHSFCTFKTSNNFLGFFFFQAEDGIRDLYVTGVQTCALPICPHLREDVREPAVLHRQAGLDGRAHHPVRPPPRRRERSQIGRASCRERVKVSEEARNGQINNNDTRARTTSTRPRSRSPRTGAI